MRQPIRRPRQHDKRVEYLPNHVAGRRAGLSPAGLAQRGNSLALRDTGSYPSAIIEGEDTPLELLGLSVRTYNAVARSGILNVEQLTATSPQVLLSKRNIGSETVKEIETALQRYYRDGPPAEIPRRRGYAYVEKSPKPGHELAPRLVKDLAPIGELELSRRIFHALRRAGYSTIGKLAATSLEQLRSAPNIGDSSIAEIEARLADRVLQQERSSTPPAPRPKRQPVRHLVPFEALADAPLETIPLSRLGLPDAVYGDLDKPRFRTIGDLLTGEPDSPIHRPVVRQALQDYLAWLAAQTPEVWNAEVKGDGLNPLHRVALRDTTLEQVAQQWFAVLDERQRQVIRLRFGFDDAPMTLEASAQQCGVTRERVRQIEKKAISRLCQSYSHALNPPLYGFATLLHQQLTLHDGQLHPATFNSRLQSEPDVRPGGINVTALVELLCAVDRRFEFWRRHGVVTLAGILPAGKLAAAPTAVRAEELPPAPASAATAVNGEPPGLHVCPDLWPDKLRDEGDFLIFVHDANGILSRKPTVEAFLDELLAWAGRKPHKTSRYQQIVLDACYVYGLIEPVLYPAQKAAVLTSRIPAGCDSAEVWGHCIRSALAALANGPRLLEEVTRRQSCTRDQLQSVLRLAGDNVDAHLRLFRNLGLLSPQGRTYRPTALAADWVQGTTGREAMRTLAEERIGVGGVELEQEVSMRPYLPNFEKISACPALLPNQVDEKSTFLEAIIHAHKFLAKAPTMEEFLREMITWAGREYPKSTGYSQNVLDSFYVVGVINRIRYENHQDLMALKSLLPIDDDVHTIRDYCVRSAIDRLKFGRQVIDTAVQLQSFSRQELQTVLNMTSYNAARHIRLFSNLGLLSQKGTSYQTTPLATRYATDRPITYEINSLPSEEMREPSNSWDSADGLEVLAFLGGIE